jgi:hypothetical protein
MSPLGKSPEPPRARERIALDTAERSVTFATGPQPAAVDKTERLRRPFSWHEDVPRWLATAAVCVVLVKSAWTGDTLDDSVLGALRIVLGL